MEKKRNPRILIVDDTPKNIQIVGFILEEENYIINVAQNGKQALELANKVWPDLILLDIMMPELDGFETCKLLKESEKTRHIPIIFLTAKTETEDIVKGFELGAVDYVTKPFSAAELSRRVKTHLELKQKTEELQKNIEFQNEMIHIMCHDLTNPISFVLTTLDIVDQKPDFFVKMKEPMRSSMKSSLELIKLIREIRALDENKLNLTIRKYPLRSLLNESISMLTGKLQKKNINLKINNIDSFLVEVEETSFINSVLNNILTNAIKFSMPNSNIVINTSLSNQSVSISIRDYGIGMPRSLQDKIFDVTKATSRPGTDGESGTGFGMPLVRKFMTAYGGTITVISKEQSDAPDDHGTEICLRLKGCLKDNYIDGIFILR